MVYSRLVLIFAILHYVPGAWSQTSCLRPKECITPAQCKARHRDAGSDTLNNSVVFRCGVDASMDCCPPVNAHRSAELYRRDKQRQRLLMPEICAPAFGDRIAHGNDTDLGEFPWMALIGRKSKVRPYDMIFVCGGSVINKRYILTAAHCVTDVALINVVRLAEHDLSTANDTMEIGLDEFETSTTTDIRVSRVTIHPDWNPVTLRNDIALVRVKRDIDFSSDYIKPICLPYTLKDIAMEGENFTVAGWGMLGPSRTGLSNVLQKAIVVAAPTSDCTSLAEKSSLRRIGVVNDTMQICVIRTPDNPGSTCKGDSGGPLSKLDTVNNNHVVVGIVSLGLGTECDVPNSATVFTRVYHYVDWILENMDT